MATKLDLKTSVARQLGKTNALVATPKRDLSIADALTQYVGELDWSWNQGTSSLADGGTLPADYNSLFNPIAYYYTGSTKTNLGLLPDSELLRFSDPVFSVDSGSFQTNVTATCTLVYYKDAPTIAANGSDNTDILVIPDITAVSRLAIALYWLAAERDEDNHDRFMKQYQDLLRRDISRDKAKVRTTRPPIGRRNMGWNSRGSSSVTSSNLW